MSTQQGANLYTQGFGSRPENVEIPVVTNVSPTSSNINFPLGKRWINTVLNAEYVLTSETTSSGVTTANWQITASPSGAIATINSQPPVAGNFNIVGTAAQISVTASAGQDVLALIGPYTPATYTSHGVLVGAGASSIVALSVGATGTLLAGTTGANPSFTSSPSVSGTVTAGTGITSTTGNIVATAGAVNAGTTMTAGTGITATTGNITATTGNFVASAAGAGVVLGGGPKVVAGSGDPNTVVTAPQGSLYLNIAGSGVANRAFINTDGATAWTAVTTAT